MKKIILKIIGWWFEKDFEKHQKMIGHPVYKYSEIYGEKNENRINKL